MLPTPVEVGYRHLSLHLRPHKLISTPRCSHMGKPSVAFTAFSPPLWPSRRAWPLSLDSSLYCRSAPIIRLSRRCNCYISRPTDTRPSPDSKGSSRRPSHSLPASSSRREYMLAALLSSIFLLTQRPPPSLSLTPATRYPPQLVVRSGPGRGRPLVVIAGGFQVPARQYEGLADRLLQPLTIVSGNGAGGGATGTEKGPKARMPGQKEGTSAQGGGGDGAAAGSDDGGEDRQEGAPRILEYPAVVGEGEPSPFDVLVMQDGNSFSNKEAEEQAVERLIASIDQRPTRPSSVLLVGHSRGGKLALKTACALRDRGRYNLVSGLVLLESVDVGGGSCLPCLSTLSLPTLLLALPYSGRSRYYKTTLDNLCAPKGADPRAFFDVLRNTTGSAVESSVKGAVGRPPVVLVTVPEAGHLQLLDQRTTLPFAESCGVGTARDADVARLSAGLVRLWAEAWALDNGRDEKEIVKEVVSHIERLLKDSGLQTNMEVLGGTSKHSVDAKR